MHSFKLENVEVLPFLEELEIRNVGEATMEEIKFSCPFPGHTSGDENPSAYMNKETTAWYCHGCKRKGNAVGFLSDLYSISTLQATRFLTDRFGAGFKYPEHGLVQEIDEFFLKLSKPEPEPLNLPVRETVLSDFCLNDASCRYLQDRGFTQETIKEWQLGYDEKSDRITIPIFDEFGRLVGIKGRALQPENQPKYKVLGGSQYGFPRYHVGLVVFGLEKAPTDSKSGILVEGELNALAMHQLGYTSTVAIGGSTFTPTHAKKIIDRFDSVMLFLDSDEAGAVATVNAMNLLEKHMVVFVAPEHQYDPAEALEWRSPGKAEAYIKAIASDAVDTLSLTVEELSA